MTVYAITDTKKGEQGLRLLIFKLPQVCYLLAILNMFMKLCTGKGMRQRICHLVNNIIHRTSLEC